MKIRQLAGIIASAALVFSTATYAYTATNTSNNNAPAAAQHHHAQKLNVKGIYVANKSAIKNATAVQDLKTVDSVQKLLTQAGVSSPVIKVYKKETSNSHKTVLVAETKESGLYKLSPGLTDKVLNGKM